jgi:hypothetical protein
MNPNFFFKSVLRSGTYFVTQKDFDGDYCDSFDVSSLLKSFEKCGITQSDEIPQNDATLIDNKEVCRAHWNAGGSEAQLYRENNIDIDTFFENCLTNTFNHFFDHSDEETFFYKHGAIIISSFFGLLFLPIMINVIYEWLFAQSIAEQNYQDLFPEQDNREVANNGAGYLPQIAEQYLDFKLVGDKPSLMMG